MGAAGSRAAGRSYQAAEAGLAARAAENAHAGAGAVAVDAQRAAQGHGRRRMLTLEEEEQLESKDQSMNSLLEKLGGAIQDRHINVMPTQSQLRPTASQTSSKGRLPNHALTELLELQQQAAGGPVDASHLVQKYRVEPQLVQQVLRVVCLPQLLTAEGSAGVQALAQYPDWFHQRN